MAWGILTQRGINQGGGDDFKSNDLKDVLRAAAMTSEIKRNSDETNQGRGDDFKSNSLEDPFTSSSDDLKIETNSDEKFKRFWVVVLHS